MISQRQYMSASLAANRTYEGQVIATYTNRADVKLDNHNQPIACTLKANLKKAGDTALTGDWVNIELVEESCDDNISYNGRIVEIHPRQNQLQRPKIANVDSVLVVQSLTQPELSYEQLDRYLIHASLAGLPAEICFTKSDLLDSEGVHEILTAVSYYQQLGYAVHQPVFNQPDTYTALEEQLTSNNKKIIVLAGVSGAGKSSLLNKLKPGLKLKEGAVGEKLARGQHTTRHTCLLAINNTLAIADTPGFSRLTFEQTYPETLPSHWPEFSHHLQTHGKCTFTNCTHLDEDGCNIKDAVESGVIPLQRYENYCVFMAEAYAGERAMKDQTDKTDRGMKHLRRKGGKLDHRVRLDQKLRGRSRRQDKQALMEHTYFDIDDDQLTD